MDRISKALARAKETRQFRPTPSDGTTAADANLGFAGALQTSVPPDFLRTMKIFADGGAGAIADAYKVLRTRVLHRMQESGLVTLGITSPKPRAGKSLTAVNLGLAIAKNPKYSVLLIDADLRNPSIHRMFGIEAQVGLPDYLAASVDLSGYLISPGIPRFAILPTPKKTANPSEVLGGARMQALIDGFRKQVGSLIVIFDLPPALFGDDVLSIAAKLDALLLIVEDGGTSEGDLRKSMELLKHTNVLGTVLNKAKEHSTVDYDYYA